MLIFLVGYMGVGKSSVGRELAKELGFRFVDTDSWIENRYCKSTPQIFEEFGEEFFRTKEKECLEFLVDQDDVVIATGGGLPCNNNLMDLMNELGEVVYLKASSSILVNRLSKDLNNRPKLANIQSEIELNTFVKTHLSEREPFYSLAKQIIEVANKTQTEIVNELGLIL